MKNTLDELTELLWKIENLGEKLRMQRQLLNELEDELDEQVILSWISTESSYFTLPQQKNTLLEDRLISLISTLQTEYDIALHCQQDLENMTTQNTAISPSILTNWKTKVSRLITQCHIYLQQLSHFHLRILQLNNQESRVPEVL